MVQTEINGKTKIVLTPAAFWSMLLFLVVVVFGAATSLAQIRNELARLADGTVSHVEFQGWADDLRDRNANLKVPGMNILSSTKNDVATAHN